MPRRSSTDQTGDEIDIVESRNSKTTSDSSRTLSGTTLPKIKPQLSSRTLRNQFKNVYKGRSSINNDSPDYSSSFASVDVSLKDLRKHSDSEAEQLIKSKRQISINSQTVSSRNRKYSVDSGVINKSSGKVTQRTDQSRISSSKTRRNSISVCPSARAEQVEQYLQQESLNVKEEVHKSVKEELRELEVKLLHEASFLEKSSIKKTSDSGAEEPIKELNKDVEKISTDDSEDESNQSNHDNLDDDAWSKIHERVKAESDAAEAKLEGYYNSLEKSELNLEETENYIALEQEQKERLLKALKDIDREAGGVSSASSIEEPEHLVNPQPIRRKSDGSNYSFSKNIENLHRGRPVHNKVKIPVIEKMKREEKEYLLDIENGKKNKADFMKELFGKLDISLQNEKFLNSKIPNETEQLIQLNRSFD